MQKQYEDQYHRVEVEHWWFAARRQAVRSLVLDVNADRNCRILEIGCSGGPLMIQLRREGYRNIVGIDCSSDAIEHCRKAGLEAQLMDAQKLTFSNASFDIITASDILEHLEDDQAALMEWHRVLRPGGLLIIFVPAFAFLWTVHDVANRHYRRYRRKQLLQGLKIARFAIERSSYWNTFLFPPVAVIRSIKRTFRGKESSAAAGIGDLFMPPRLLNAAFLAVMRLENRFFSRGVNWPFGVSVMAVARRPQNNVE